MADKIVKLVDKNSNNLYPVAGSVIDNAVSTGAISSQAVTNPKIENGAVNGVANDATAIGTAKLALDTVGTPNLRDESVTSDKIDWTTLGFQSGRLVGNSSTNVPGTFTETLFGDTITFSVENGATYMVFCNIPWITHNSTKQIQPGAKITSGNNSRFISYQIPPQQNTDSHIGISIFGTIVADGGNITIQRGAYAYTNCTVTTSLMDVWMIRVG